MNDSASRPVRVRFAPSPTGYLHLGGVRTALFNWLFARHHGGTFILRIDDTDVKRHREEAVRIILDGLRWVGLSWDEGPEREGGCGPYYQSQRYPFYQEAARKLEAAGRAYWATKSPAEGMPEWKVEKLKKQGNWDEELAAAARDTRPALYFKLHTGEPRDLGFQDAVYGAYSRPAELLADFVLLRGDGTPTYNFASAIDDLELRISHVIRGEEHLSNTPKQLAIFEALGAPAPVFAHLPLIYNDKGRKISKRSDPVAVTVFQKAGLLPEGLFNFLALLGWSPGDNREKMTVPEMIEAFSLERIKQSPAQFHLKRKSELAPGAGEEQHVGWLQEALPGSKLEWLNGEYLREMEPAKLLARLEPFLALREIDPASRPGAWWGAALRVEQQRGKTLVQVADQLRLYFHPPRQFDPKAVQKVLLKNDGLALLRAVRDLLAGVQPWEGAVLEQALEGFTQSRGLKFGLVAQPIRVALSGTTVSPSLHETLFLLGREESFRRIDFALAQSWQ